MKRPCLAFAACFLLGSFSVAQTTTPNSIEGNDLCAYGTEESCSAFTSSANSSTTPSSSATVAPPPQSSRDVVPNQLQPLSSANSRESDRSEPRQPVNPSQKKRSQEPPRTEFEQVVADTIGRPVPRFSRALFLAPPSTFAPLERLPVPPDYVIGPDDELQVRIWGQINADLRLIVDRSGQIYLPKVGLISVVGIRASQLSAHLTSAVERTYRSFKLVANVGRIHAIQVFVVGQARFPGTYTISSLSTLVNAVFASGGPTSGGSLRDIQVQRGKQTVAHLDFYQLLLQGDKSGDVHLENGDVIYFPAVGPLMAVAGSVNNAAIFEMKAGATLGELLEAAGGLSTVADPSEVSVERTGLGKQRTVLAFPLDATAKAMTMQDGDIVRVMSKVARFGNTVTLRGNVVNPGRYPWTPGMKILDLIPNSQALLTRAYWLNRTLMVDNRSTAYPIKPDRPTRTANQSNRDEPAASITENFTLSKTEEQPRAEDDRRLAPNAHTLTEDMHRSSPEINWSYAIVQRVNPADLSTTLLPFNLGQAVLQHDAASNIELQPDDIVTIFSQADITVPLAQKDRYVTLEGEVEKPGVYKVKDQEELRGLIQRAGGLTSQAYIYGTQLTRESAREQQQKSLDEFSRAMELEIRQSMASASTHQDTGAESMNAEQRAQESLLARIHDLKASGRVTLVLRPEARTVADYPEVKLEDNDRIVIPPLPSTVSVVGMVYSQGSFLYDRQKTVGDYLRLAGRGQRTADMHRAFVIRADGSVVPSTAMNGSFRGNHFAALRLHPGDQIVVPNKVQTGGFLRGLRDWTQVSSQLALTGAALAVIQ